MCRLGSYSLQQFMSHGNFLFHNQCYSIHNLKDLGMFNGIKDLQAFLSASQNSRRQHQVQMARGIGLFLADCWENFADATLAVT